MVVASAEFEARTDPLRGEMLAHCYRMMGSIHDAEDVVQETYLRAWRSYDQFEGRSSLRTWLYTIATRACLTALEGRGRRPLPSGLGAASEDHTVALDSAENLPWLEPAPDFGAHGGPNDPASIVAARAGVRLAFIAALQHLPVRQRAVLILRDVLGWRAAEVAHSLDTTTAAVNGALLRARATLASARLDSDTVSEPDDPDLIKVLDQWVSVFERGDIDGLVTLLRTDVEFEMPPVTAWFAGRAGVSEFFALRVLTWPKRWRLLPIHANGQPALAVYQREGGGEYMPYGIQVLEVTAQQVSRIVMFPDPSLFPRFNLPQRADGGPAHDVDDPATLGSRDSGRRTAT